MKYQRREGTADGNDKYSIANQGGRRDDNNDNDHDCDNGEEIDDEKYSKTYLEGHNDNDHVVHSTADTEGLGVVVKAVTAGEISDMNLATNLVHDWDLSVSEEPSATMETPDLVEKCWVALFSYSLKHTLELLLQVGFELTLAHHS